MSISLNISNIDTIGYRTDCLKSDSISKHYIRHHDVKYSGTSEYNDGYEDKYINVEGMMPDESRHLYNLGFNPFLSYPVNPIICDKLLMFGSFRDTKIIPIREFVYDLCYTNLLFAKPMLLIDNVLDISSSEEGIKYVLMSGMFLLIDELHVEYDSPNRYLYGSGKYYDGSYNSFINRKLCSLINNNGTQCQGANRVDMCIEYPKRERPFNDYTIGYNGLKDFICTNSELLSRFAYSGNPPTELLNLLNSYAYGALMIPKRALVVQALRNGIYDQFYPGTTMWWMFNRLFEIMIIPFDSEDEYNAAYASIYTWSHDIPQQ